MFILLALGIAAAYSAIVMRQMTPLQRYYLPGYILVGLYPQTKEYVELDLITTRGTLLATDGWVEPMPQKFAMKKPPFLPWLVSEYGRSQGGLYVKEQTFVGPTSRLVPQNRGRAKIYSTAADYRARIRSYIYGDRSILSFFFWPLLLGVLALIGLVPVGVFYDLKHNRIARRGRELRGPDLVTRHEFNKKVKGDGIQFLLSNPPSFLELLQGAKAKHLKIKAHHESNNFLIMGDIGSGKSSIIKQMIMQVERRGQAAVIYDPHLEFTKQFFNAERGDIILNPEDVRCPFWSPGNEIEDWNEAEALTLAESIWPGEQSETNFFFKKTARHVFAYLLATYKPTPQELGFWLAHPEEIDNRVAGTELEHTLSNNSPPQRNGILGTLNEIAQALRMLPKEEDTTSRFSIREWAQHRRGWIFITSTPKTRAALRPLNSLWFDLLVLYSLSEGDNEELERVWFFLDELSKLNTLPQLETVITENRKFKLSIVAGFQGRSQVNNLYKGNAETIFSQPYTKFLLRTSEPEAAKWMSNMIGEIEIERVRESRPAHDKGTHKNHSYSTETRTEQLIMGSEIQGLTDRTGYIKYGNFVVKISYPFVDRPAVAPGLIRRQFVPRPKRTMTETAPSAQSEIILNDQVVGDDKPTSQEIFHF